MTEDSTAAVHKWARNMGLNTAYYDSQILANEWLAAQREVNRLNEDRRQHLEEIENRKADLAEEEWRKNPNSSVAMMESHLKILYRSDPIMRKFRRDLSEIQGKLDEAEAKARSVELQLRIETARIEELAGYFHLQAAVKAGNLYNSHNSNNSDSDTTTETESTR